LARITQTPYWSYQHLNSVMPPAWPVTVIIQTPSGLRKKPIA
jgi:hypothetical protein